MKKSKKIIFLILGLVFIVVLWLLFFRKKEQVITFETEKPQRGSISESVTATGTIQPVDTTSVGSRVSGTIEELHADYNSSVKKGELLAVLDPSLMQATVDQFKASLAEAKSNQVYQESNFNRQKQLYQTGSVSRAEYELALNSYNNAKAGVRNIQAQLYSAQRNLSFTKIYAPVDGVILNRTVSVGQTVAASFNTPTLFTIAKDITKMQVQAKVDEADIGNVQKGQRATFTVDAYLKDLFEGTVEEIRLSPVVSSNVVTYTTIINAPNENKKLKPGMTANITIYTKESRNALLIPAKALKYSPDSSLGRQYVVVPLKHSYPHPGGKSGEASQTTTNDNEGYVWILDANKIVQKKVSTGLNNNTQVEVLNGLNANDVLITGMQSGVTAATGAASSPFMPKPPGRKK
ncbi:HlyD family secretion protein [Arcticibacter tournemirensis]|uniref:Efflux RND transporter periplasmic adaptor subunit n=1 Tax=Arcticibacter tournemirensis TaxID=699437 RepID=A0A5M9H809_9SPHI|nr:efflux RND transporter periplasmic adaptor subunit [Arcticibacter tournemirensis]KAA8482730.1 efflux RND transporter periplasmic adaptor subunit [Arcticibacter tournemirensis]TQM51024.1 HlyD family secretion protein [Arcticibacter tournemirensis]